ncbi:MAG: protein-glutamate O-methyltransferase [Pseudomonadota bacterium]
MMDFGTVNKPAVPKESLILENPSMSDQEFARLSGLFYGHTGITLPHTKKNMLTSRLMKRVKILGLRSFGEYYDYIVGDGRDSEFLNAVDMVSTNKTEFFREPVHFTYLRESALPDLAALRAGHGKKKIEIWSAGCSSGEEIYTLAMVLAEFSCNSYSLQFTITGTDISQRMLEKAQRGVYNRSEIQGIPPDLLRKYFLRGTRSQSGYYRVVPELRNKVDIHHLNLMEDAWSMQPDIIFCRNVMIYFDHETRNRLINKFYSRLLKDGYLFIGHSETLHGMETDFKLLIPTIYRKC